MAKAFRACAALAAASWLAPVLAHDTGWEPAPPPAAGEEAEPPAEAGLLDSSHQAVEESLGGLVDWLDHFFADPRYLEFGPQRSTLRWRSEVRLTDEPRAYPRTTALVDLRLPAAGRWLSRLHLVLAGEGEAEEATAASQGSATELSAGQGLLELRLDLVRRPGTLLYLGSGVRLRWPPEPVTRLRLRQDVPLATSLLARLTPSAFWEERQGFGASLQLDLDQAVARTALVRASGSAMRSENSRGLEWAASLEARDQIATRMAGALGGSMRGAERSPVAVEQYRAFARLRRDVLRRWLFLEVEPEVVWPVAPSGARLTVLGVILRLEVLFETEALPPEPAPPGESAAPAEVAPLPR